MSNQTKLLSAAPATTTIGTGEYLAKVDAAGHVTRISLADLRAAVENGRSLDLMLDNVFIMYHRKSDNIPRMVKPQTWPSLQNAGEVADGVVVVDGGHVLVVAPTGSSGLYWSSAEIFLSMRITDRLAAIADFNGKSNTATIISASSPSVITDTAAYAAGFCNLYSHGGLEAGKWWLPSVGEMMMIYANMQKINYCLSLLTGATLLPYSWYWTSTDHSLYVAWNLDFNNGILTQYMKANNMCVVRPVSAFIQ